MKRLQISCCLTTISYKRPHFCETITNSYRVRTRVRKAWSFHPFFLITHPIAASPFSLSLSINLLPTNTSITIIRTPLCQLYSSAESRFGELMNVSAPLAALTFLEFQIFRFLRLLLGFLGFLQAPWGSFRLPGVPLDSKGFLWAPRYFGFKDVFTKLVFSKF